MLSLTTGQVHDLLVSFTHDYPGCKIRSIRICACNEVVSISYVDTMDIFNRVEYSIKTSVEFVKKDD